MTKRRGLLALAGTAATARGAAAQGATGQAASPSRPVRVVVAAAAGSAPDTAFRLMADRFAAAWRQPVVVDNRPGAGGNLGAAAVARAAPDGHTLFFAHATPIVLNQHLVRTMPLDPACDLVPVTLLLTTPFLLAARPGLGVTDLAGLVALARRRDVTFATSGATNVPRLAGEGFARAAGITMTNVPYNASPAAVTDTLAGRTDLVIDGTPLLAPQVRAGTLVPLGITSAARFPGMEAIPALAETYPGVTFVGWFGFLAPAGTPAPVVGRVAATARSILAEPALAARLLHDFGAEVATGTPEEFTAFAAARRATFGRLVREIGILPE